MKKKLGQIILALTFLLTACGQTPPLTQPTLAPVIDDSTSTSSPLPTATQTTHPTETPTASITPLPTITPTFDARTIVTFTSASPAECLKTDLSLIPDFKIPTEDNRVFIGTDGEILDYLNQGGTMQSVVKRLNGNGDPVIQDVTGDNVSELIFIDFGLIPRLHIFVCNNGVYQLFSPKITSMSPEDFYSTYLETINDMNGNNLKDIILSQRGCSGSGCFKITVYEWNGKDFVDIAPDATMTGLLEFQINDTDKNGLPDISLHGGLFGGCCMPGDYPRRMSTDIYKWNGNVLEYSETQYDPPIFRFQALQDADQFVLSDKYDKALTLYQDTIFSDKLEWWSMQRAEFTALSLQYSPPSWPDTAPPPMEPISADIAFEYNSLAAYSYFRIVQLHIIQGHKSDAATVYNTLQQKFTTDPYGRPYVEMGTAFWDAYQSTYKMYDGCAAAIQYADEHPKILIPLGSDYHGWQSHQYKPEDVCPFR